MVEGLKMLSNFELYLKENYLYQEMAIEGDVPKTPVLFNEDDIRYLYQFPPKFWIQALKARYNNLLLSYKERQEKGQEIPEKDGVKIQSGNKTYVFPVKTGMKKLIDRLEKDFDVEGFSTLHPHEHDKYQTREKNGLHGFPLNQRTVSPHNREEWFSSGYVPLKYHTKSKDNPEVGGNSSAARTLRNWEDMSQEGWLGDIAPNMKEFDKKAKHAAPPEYLQKLGFNSSDGTINWKYYLVDYEHRNAEGKPSLIAQNESGHVPILLPGKLINSASMRQYNKKIKEAEEAEGSGQKEKGQALRQEAEQMKKDAARHDEFAWNVHRHNSAKDAEGKPMYSSLHGRVNTAGGFNPNKGSAESSVLENPEEQEKASQLLAKYLLGDKYEASKDAHYVLGQDSKRTQHALDSLKHEIDTARSRGDADTAKRLEKELEQTKLGKWVRGGPIRDGLQTFLRKDIYGTPEEKVLSGLFDDLVQQAAMEIFTKTKVKGIREFVDYLLGKNDDPNSYKKFYQVVNALARDYGRRAAQLDFGRGTRRLRKSQSMVLRPEVHSLFQSLGNEEGVSMVDLIKSYVSPSELGAAERGHGARTSLRKTGGIFSDEMISFGHQIKAMLGRIKAADQAMRSSRTGDEKAVKDDVALRIGLFNKLVDLYIAKQMVDNSPWNMATAYDFADQEMRKILVGHGIEVSNAPTDYRSKGEIGEKELENQKQEKEMILKQKEQIDSLIANPNRLKELRAQADATQDPKEKERLGHIIQIAEKGAADREAEQNPMAMAARVSGQPTQQQTQDVEAQAGQAQQDVVRRLSLNPLQLAQAKRDVEKIDEPDKRATWTAIIAKAEEEAARRKAQQAPMQQPPVAPKPVYTPGASPLSRFRKPQ